MLDRFLSRGCGILCSGSRGRTWCWMGFYPADAAPPPTDGGTARTRRNHRLSSGTPPGSGGKKAPRRGTLRVGEPPWPLWSKGKMPKNQQARPEATHPGPPCPSTRARTGTRALPGIPATTFGLRLAYQPPKNFRSGFAAERRRKEPAPRRVSSTRTSPCLPERG